MPPKDEVLPAEEQPLPVTVSPTADLPRYIPKSDPEEDPEEDPADYPADGGDDDDDEESSDDDEDDDEDVKEDEEEEEGHPALSDSVPPHIHRIPSPPLPVSSPLPVSPPPPTSPTYLLGYRATMIRLRADAPSTSHPPPLGTPPSGTPPLLPILVPTSSPSLLLPSTDHRANVPDVCLPPQKRLCIAFGPRITNTWDEMLEDMPGAPVSDETELGRRMTNFVTTVRQNTDEVYSRLADTQDARAARLSREAWSRSMEASDTACAEVMSLRTTVLAQQSEIVAFWAVDRTRQAQLTETLRLISTLQAQVITLQSQRGPASGPAQPDVSEEAGSSS
ncbi:hypothetical protein Tco_1380627 [Tanacetum coccineum]